MQDMHGLPSNNGMGPGQMLSPRDQLNEEIRNGRRLRFAIGAVLGTLIAIFVLPISGSLSCLVWLSPVGYVLWHILYDSFMYPSKKRGNIFIDFTAAFAMYISLGITTFVMSLFR